MPIVITEAKIFACTQSKVLGEKIAKAFGAELGNVITSTYSDGEFQPSNVLQLDILQQYYHILVGLDKIEKISQEYLLQQS